MLYSVEVANKININQELKSTTVGRVETAEVAAAEVEEVPTK